VSDEELIRYLGLAGEPKAQRVIANLTPAKRACYERMASLETDLFLWENGLGPRPSNVLIDYPRKAFR
jgi:hypothetical protein